jgi:hypothetical protein
MLLFVEKLILPTMSKTAEFGKKNTRILGIQFFLLTGILTQNFNTMDLVKFLEENQNCTFRS